MKEAICAVSFLGIASHRERFQGAVAIQENRELIDDFRCIIRVTRVVYVFAVASSDLNTPFLRC